MKKFKKNKKLLIEKKNNNTKISIYFDKVAELNKSEVLKNFRLISMSPEFKKAYF